MRRITQWHGISGMLLCWLPLVGMSQTNFKAILQNTSTTISTLDKTDTSKSAMIKNYYRLGKTYKDGNSVAMNYANAYYYFHKAAELGDPQSIYAVGYMKYKGLGTIQDYASAARLFAQGAYQGRDNSMYFYGLCWRNGYGLMQNEDSAQCWLKRAAALGYKQAILELQSKAPENLNGQASQLVQKIYNAAVPKQIPLNQFISIQPQKPDSSIIAGDYEGYVIQYDWSGKYPISTKKLQLFLEKTKKLENLQGKWLEENADSVSVKAFIKSDSLIFEKTLYSRKDHYSLSNGIEYDFQNAVLNLARQGDSVYLAGNIFMFSPDRKEPSKPLFIALVRTINPNSDDNSLIEKQQDTSAGYSNANDAQLLSVYPNPFVTYINVTFKVNETTKVGVELFNMAGQQVYAKPLQQLAQGIYKIRIEPSLRLPQQTYILRLVFTNGKEAVEVIKK